MISLSEKLHKARIESAHSRLEHSKTTKQMLQIKDAKVKKDEQLAKFDEKKSLDLDASMAFIRELK